MKKQAIVGIDLAGSPRRNTGICVMKGNRVDHWTTVHTDDEIIWYVENAGPSLVAIDAPLTLPPGRKTIDDRNGEHFRACDRELLNRKIRFFPVTLGPMRMLTVRGIALARRLRRRGCTVIEIYPGGAQDVWKIARKQDGLPSLRRGLAGLGVHGLNSAMNGDELDAVTGALVGQWYVKGRAEVLGGSKHRGIVLPLPSARKQPKKARKR